MLHRVNTNHFVIKNILTWLFKKKKKQVWGLYTAKEVLESRRGGILVANNSSD